MENSNYTDVPQPHNVSQKERERSLAAYFMMFFSSIIGLPLPLLNLLAAWIYHESTKKTSKFVHFHSLQSLYSQLPLTLCNMVLIGWFFKIIFSNVKDQGELIFSSYFKGYIILVILLNLIYYIFSVVAAIQSYRGKMYYFLFFGRLAYLRVFKNNGKQISEKTQQNFPPKL